MAHLGQINLQWSISLIQALIDQGITRFVISPGSRSTPLALAVARNPLAQHQVIIDERSAAFFALGQSRQQRSPSVLICTSGSAVANWLPAVVEANHAAVPLLLLSADRPAELHQRGANQTIEQEQLFGVQVRGHHSLSPPDEEQDPTAALTTLLQEMMVQLRQPVPGPVHINIPFREPLLPETFDSIDWSPAPIQFLPQRTLSRRWLLLNEAAEKIHQHPGIILCGEGHYPDTFYNPLNQLAERLDCPIMVDPLSNLRWGHAPSARILTHYDATLRNSSSQPPSPQWVIQFGDFPLSKTVANWLTQNTIPTYFTIQYQRLWSDPESLATEVFHCSPEQFVNALLKQLSEPAQLPEWNHHFTTLEQQAHSWVSPYPLCTQQLLHTLLNQLPEESVLFSANSMMIRDIDGWLPADKKSLTLHANRGASGIDGNLSTACGVRSVVEAEVPVVALLGDLTLFHDLNALSLVQQLEGEFTIIVVNNGGGGIFSYLPPAELPEFEPLWLTPPEIDFKQAAKLYQIEYYRIDEPLDLQQQLAHPLQKRGAKLIEWVVDREATITAHQQYWESLQ